MPKSKDPKINWLRKLRRYYLRVAERAKKRRATAVYRRNRRKANRVLRTIRHRRRVLSIRHRPPGLVWMDGKQVAAWVADELDKARRAGWRGYVVSGYRTPAYSERLCYGMCGAPRCPGRCAGRSSNHSQGYIYPHGAVDVTDWQTLDRLSHSLNLRIRNALPADRVHFSATGK